MHRPAQWMPRLAVVVSALAAASPLLAAQASPGGGETQTVPGPPRSWIFLPAVAHAPETGWAGGVVAAWYEGGGVEPRSSSVLTALTATTRGQVLLESYPELYPGGGRWRVKGEVKARKYPDVFYGIGNTAPEEAEEDFTSRTFDLRVDVQREMRRDLWLGLRLRTRNDELTEVESGGMLDEGDVLGQRGGGVVALGLAMLRDTRDSRYRPRRGRFVELVGLAGGPSLGGDYEFQALEADLRTYHALGERSELALRAVARATFGDAPFYLLPALGGSSLMRGYREGRFRDERLGVVQAEVRTRLWWRIGGVAFASLGDVAADLGDWPRPGDLERAAGLGLRFRVNEGGVNIRLDLARGREGTEFYLSLGEAY